MPNLRLFSAIVLFAVSAPLPVLASGCTTPAGTAGDQIYNSTSNTMQYCNGANWVNMGTTQGVGTLTSPDLCTTDGSVINCTTQTVPVPDGGTGVNTLTAHGVLIGEGSSVMAATPAGTSNDLLQANGSSSDPTWTNTLTGVTLAGTTTLPGSGVISSSGTVGIGTTSPTGVFNVNSGSSTSTITLQGSSGTDSRFLFNVGGTTSNRTMGFFGNVINVTATNSGTAQPLEIQGNGGNVGIGTTGPVNTLEIKGTAANPSTSGTSSNGIVRVSSSSVNRLLDIGLSTGSPIYAWLQARDATTYASNYSLALNPNGGNIGIGTTAPAYLLDVGVAATSGVVANFGNAGSGNANYIDFNEGLGFIGYNASNLMLQSSSGSGISFKVNSNTANSGTLAMYISSLGNVGIGTITPQATLDVNGYARLTLQSSQPVACSSTNQGAIALNHLAQACACNGTSWIFADSVGAACSW
jgi:hypothetical protein